MKIYLAGASSDLAACEHWRDKLIAAGHVITHDWVSDVQAAIACGLRDHDHPPEERRAFALKDLRGVADADLVWILSSDGNSIGRWVELGFALAAARPLIGSGPWRTIFQDVIDPRFQFGAHEEAWDWILTHCQTEGT